MLKGFDCLPEPSEHVPEILFAVGAFTVATLYEMYRNKVSTTTQDTSSTLDDFTYDFLGKKPKPTK